MASYVNNDSNKLNNISYRDLMVFKVQDLVFLIAHISAAYHFDKQKYLHFHIELFGSILYHFSLCLRRKVLTGQSKCQPLI